MKRLCLGLGLSLLAVGSSCQSPVKDGGITSVSLNNTMSADEVATVLLNEVDVLGTVFAVRPQTVQFNDHLDELDNTDSEFFVSRQWINELDGKAVLANAITKYISAAVAQEQIIELAGDHERLQPEVVVGDSQVVYQDGDLVTYRFVMGVYGVRVTADTLTTATDLAELQADKLADIGHAPNIELSSNAAVQHLPEAVTGGTLLGTASVTAEEWLGTILDVESEEIEGFVTGGVRRWQMTGRPAEVVEITILEMETAEAATTFAAGLLPSSDVGIEIELPASIANLADAVDNANVIELQAGVGNYFVDIVIMAPFGELDVETAKANIVTIGQDVITNFVP